MALQLKKIVICNKKELGLNLDKIWIKSGIKIEIKEHGRTSFVKTIISSVNNWLKSWIYGFAVKKLSFLMENGIMLRDFRLEEYLKTKKIGQLQNNVG